MTSELKQQIEQGFNTASMIAFAIPEVGPVGGALLTGGGAAFHYIFSFPGHDDPLDRIPTERDLQQLKGDLIAAIQQAFDTHDLELVADNIGQHVKTLRGAWNDTTTEQGLTFIGKFRDTAAETNWVNDRTNALQGPLKFGSNGETPVLLADVDKIQKSTAARYKGVGLYVWAVNTYILYCKVAMLWEYVVALRNHGIADYKNSVEQDKEGKALLAWNMADKATRAPTPPHVPPPLAKMVDKKTFTSTSYYVKLMVEQLAGPDAWRQAAIKGKSKPDPDANGKIPSAGDSYLMLQYLIDTYDTVNAAFEKMDAEYQKHKAGTKIKYVDKTFGQTAVPGRYYFFVDSVNGHTSHEDQSMSVVQTGMDAYLGAVQLGLADLYLTKKGFGDWDKDILADVKKVIDSWTSALKDAHKYLSTYDDVHLPPLFET